MTLPTYISRFSIPYSEHSLLNTLDLHYRRYPPASPTYNVIYIHGGAFRDPLITSHSLIPSLPLLFQNPQISAAASLNYRLSPFPDHPTRPSGDTPERREKEGRNAHWPDYINEVRSAISWLSEQDEWRGRDWICVGHSVGATMGMMLALQSPHGAQPDGNWGVEKPLTGLRALVLIAGIDDFVALRDAHPVHRDIYDAFTTAAFGPENAGGWEVGNIASSGRELRDEMEVVVRVQSRDDELVDKAQGDGFWRIVEKSTADRMALEVRGGHDEIVKDGVVIGRCVERAVRLLSERRLGSGDE